MAKCKITLTCQHCKTDYVPWTGNRGKYCSPDCYQKRTRIICFWRQVGQSTSCWLWLGSFDKDGYGKIGNDKAHRRSWEIHYGPIPDSQWVLHYCDNPPCVNPEHLFLGDATKNMKDRYEKGRYAVGERHPMAIITESTVRQIRESYIPRQNGGLTALGLEHGIARTTVHAIITRKIWKHI